MLSFEQFYCALTRPQTPENIGSVARALRVMGFKPAHVIEPQCDPEHERAHVLASHAGGDLALMPRHKGVEQLRSQVDLLIGFSARGRVYGPDPIALPDITDLLQQHQNSRIGLLFGPESSGLSNDDLSYCHYSCYIPTPPHTDYHSLNLAQSVQVVAYALSQIIGFTPSQHRELPEQEQSAEFSYHFLEEWLQQALARQGFKAFTQRTTLEQTEKKARIMLQRLVRDQEDLDFLCGFIKACQKGAQ